MTTRVLELGTPRGDAPPTTDLPLRLLPIHQVSDLSDKFKDEVAAFKSNQGGY